MIKERSVYRAIADELRQRIEAGRYRPRMPLPSELHLQQEFGVARDTVRNAIAVLVELGLVRTIAGRGSYVRQLEVATVKPEPGMRIFARPATQAERDRLDSDWVLVVERIDGDVEVFPAESAEIRIPLDETEELPPS